MFAVEGETVTVIAGGGGGGGGGFLVLEPPTEPAHPVSPIASNIASKFKASGASRAFRKGGISS